MVQNSVYTRARWIVAKDGNGKSTLSVSEGIKDSDI